MPSIIRYPGSKAKLAGDIRDRLPAWCQCNGDTEPMFPAPAGTSYVEPFFGSGAMGLKLLKDIPRSVSVWINDIDYGMYALWQAVANHTRELVQLVDEFVPATEAFYELKEKDGTSTGCVVMDGFNKLALHRMSVSGFGRMAGGPIGGKGQSGDYTVGCRWSPASIQQAIYVAKRRLMRFEILRITNLHFRDVLAEVDASSLVYLDPPYYVKGGQLYAHNMSEAEHEELARLLHDTPADWRLSYDDCHKVRELYAWAAFAELEIRYTNAVTSDRRPKNRELLISPPYETDGNYVGMGWVGKDGQP